MGDHETCDGCVHERRGKCAMLPKQFAGTSEDHLGRGRPIWSWPDADERCGCFLSYERKAEIDERLAGEAKP